MSDPSGGNFPPDDGGKGSKAADGTKPRVALTINDQPIRATAESLPDPDAWGTASEPPIVGVPVKNAAAYADTAVLPVYDPLSKPPASPNTVPDGPTIVPTGETGRPPAQPPYETAPGTTLPVAPHNVPPYGPPINGDAPSAGPFVTPAPQPVVAAPYVAGQNSAQASAASPGTPRPPGMPRQQLIMLAGVVGGLFLLLGIVIGIMAISRPTPVPVAIEAPSAPIATEATPPPEPAAPVPVAPPVPVMAPVAHPKPKKDAKDAGAGPASSASSKPAGSSSSPPGSSAGAPGAMSGGSTSADAGRRGGRKVPH